LRLYRNGDGAKIATAKSVAIPIPNRLGLLEIGLALFANLTLAAKGNLRQLLPLLPEYLPVE